MGECKRCLRPIHSPFHPVRSLSRSCLFTTLLAPIMVIDRCRKESFTRLHRPDLKLGGSSKGSSAIQVTCTASHTWIHIPMSFRRSEPGRPTVAEDWMHQANLASSSGITILLLSHLTLREREVSGSMRSGGGTLMRLQISLPSLPNRCICRNTPVFS